MRKLSCAECCYLNKAEKEKSVLNRYRYRCMFSRRDYIVGSIQKDSELKTMGFSEVWTMRRFFHNQDILGR